mgnify:CR=1 FL=1
MENKGFLTFEEARDQAENYYEFEKGVYMYEIEGKGSKLVEDGEVLVDGADYVHWFEKGVYNYVMEGEGWKLIEHGEVMVGGVPSAWWDLRLQNERRRLGYN